MLSSSLNAGIIIETLFIFMGIVSHYTLFYHTSFFFQLLAGSFFILLATKPAIQFKGDSRDKPKRVCHSGTNQTAAYGRGRESAPGQAGQPSEQIRRPDVRFSAA